MPNPKAGTVTVDVGKAVEEFKAGRIEYRNDRYGNVHAPIGKVSFGAMTVMGNLAALTPNWSGPDPAAAKGRYIRHSASHQRWDPAWRWTLPSLDDLAALAR